MSLIQLSSFRALLNFNPEHKGAEAGCQLVTLGKEERRKNNKRKGKEGKEKMASVTDNDVDLTEDGLPTCVTS